MMSTRIHSRSMLTVKKWSLVPGQKIQMYFSHFVRRQDSFIRIFLAGPSEWPADNWSGSR